MPMKKMAMSFVLLTGFITSGPATAESLESVIFKTLASHPEMIAQLNRKSATEQALRQSQSGYYPTVDLLAGVGNENSKNRFTKAAGETDYVDLTRSEEAFIVTQNLFEGFGTQSNVDKNTANVRAADHRLHNLTEQTALRVAEVYLQVLQQQELVRISEATLNLHLQLFDKVKSRSSSGVGRKSDIDQATGRVARARANLISDQANLQNAYSSYMRVVGEMPIDLLKPQDKEQKLPADLEQAIKLALENNPSLKAVQSDLDAAHARRDEAKSPYYPTLDLVFEQSRGENLDGIEGVEKDYSLMLKMRYNIFNGGYDSARVTEAGYKVNEVRENLEDTKRQVVESMRLTWNTYAAVRQQLPYLEQHVTATFNSRAAYSDQFKIGARTLLDLLDSENELYQAQRARISAEYNRRLGVYRILANIGIFVEELRN
jgi:adhesin transport system outer membrane protein